MGSNSQVKTTVADFASSFFHAESKTDYNFSKLNFLPIKAVPFDFQLLSDRKRSVEGTVLRENHRSGGFF